MKKEYPMKNERILDALGNVEEKYIAEAAPLQRRGKGFRLVKWGAAAACLALAVYGGMRLTGRSPSGLPDQGRGENPSEGPDQGLEQNSTGLPDQSRGENPSGFPEGGGSAQNPGELPLLAVTGNGQEAMGYEGYMAFDVSELINSNPWSREAQLSTLPVYRNPLSYDDNYIVSGTDFDAMRSFLTDVAGRLGMDTEQLNIEEVGMYSPEQQEAVTEKLGGEVPEGFFDPTEVRAEENGVEIRVDGAMTAQITFEPAISLPEGYHFTHYSSYEEIRETAGYLGESYSALLGMKQPKLNIHDGWYDIYRRQHYSIGFYDTGDSVTEEILNYHFRQVIFYCNDEGKLWMVRIFNGDLSDKAGEYPILSAAEAEELLLGGYYITTVPYEIPGKEYVAGVELVYRTGKYEEYYMPYYRFLIEIPEMEGEDGLKDYGAYYVPAVQREYITGMPLWDGSF